LQGQVLLWARQQLGVRVSDITAEDVDRALWEERSLVKTWAMRGTLHILTADDLPLYVSALQATRSDYDPAWLESRGITGTELHEAAEAVPEALDGRCLTRQELARGIMDSTGMKHLEETLLSGWGFIPGIAAARGYLCFGPSQGTKVTFVRPDQWLGRWEPIDSAEALREVIRRYLRAYGPCTHHDFARWWGVKPAVVFPFFEEVRPELEETKIEGYKAWAHAETLKEICELDTHGVSARLLPAFDTYVMATSRRRDKLVPEPHFRNRISLGAAGVACTVAVNGRLEGTWKQERKRRAITLHIEPFRPLAKEVVDQVQKEGERLGRFLATEVEVLVNEPVG
jgi:hypothetical protein